MLLAYIVSVKSLWKKKNHRFSKTVYDMLTPIAVELNVSDIAWKKIEKKSKKKKPSNREIGYRTVIMRGYLYVKIATNERRPRILFDQNQNYIFWNDICSLKATRQMTNGYNSRSWISLGLYI